MPELQVAQMDPARWSLAHGFSSAIGSGRHDLGRAPVLVVRDAVAAGLLHLLYPRDQRFPAVAEGAVGFVGAPLLPLFLPSGEAGGGDCGFLLCH